MFDLVLERENAADRSVGVKHVGKYERSNLLLSHVSFPTFWELKLTKTASIWSLMESFMKLLSVPWSPSDKPSGTSNFLVNIIGLQSLTWSFETKPPVNLESSFQRFNYAYSIKIKHPLFIEKLQGRDHP